MPKKNFGRRKFMTHVMKILAVITGLGVSEVSKLLEGGDIGIANSGHDFAQKYNIYQKSSDYEIKALKVLVEDNRKVFENEFGRITGVNTISDKKRPGELMKVCQVEWIGQGSIIETCETVYSKGGSCPNQVACGENTCDEQDCDRFISCGKNTCPGQNCPRLGNCTSINSQVFSRAFFDKHKSDPYVQQLFMRFDVSTSDELATQVKNLLIRIR